ncbi:MAG: Rpn family recombination-promoting nuclease/putative transposase [Methylococcaceae bacterium]
MRHAIDPKIDCVFKALLGSEENRNLLIHFLNAFLAQDLIEPLVWVEILNPYNDKEFLTDKLSIVDVKARDSHDRLYQIEIQLTRYGHLPARIIYNWTDIYSQQLKSGQDYLQLRPTYSIWLLAENLISDDNETVHHYKMRDEQGNTLTQHGGIWLLELKKFKANHVETEDQRWLKFFREGEQLNDEALPDWMITREMKQAMSTLSTFSEKDQHYYQYQARQEYLREQRTIQHELEQARRALLQANQREDAAKKREELALQEKQAAQKREELALQEKQAAQSREEAAQKREELALQEKQTAQQREELAIAEIEHLKALLSQKE